jgi:HAE1 family hydrophobic/amphiphilic exporter-1
MMTLALVVFGALGYRQLGIDRLPNLEFPVVTVFATLEGASPEVMEEDVTEILEEHINSVPGLRTLKSVTSNSMAMVQAEFHLEIALDQATQDVRDKIALARPQLPRDLDPPVVEKRSMGSQPVIWVSVSSDRKQTDVTEYLKHTIKPMLETIPDVASVVPFGWRERAVRIWVDGEALRARGLSASDVISAMSREHVEAPGGVLESGELEYSLKTQAEFETVEELQELILAEHEGSVVRLRDVARVEDGAEDLRFISRFDGRPGAGIGVVKQPQGNTVSISNYTRERVRSVQGSLPTGIEMSEDGLFDFSMPIREAVAETQFALVFGALLATLTVFVFLRRWRATLVVAAAIPLSLITTFGVVWMFGFTLNVMTLLAMTLAVGVVIDDAIVVLENIERHREQGETPREAASVGTAQIAFAATAATFAIAAIFLPVAFVTGIVGSFLSEFGATVASAVLISLFVALTLTPMLAARIPPPKERAHGSLYHRLEQGFGHLERFYKGVLYWSLGHRGQILVIAVASFAVAVLFGSRLGTEFMPPEDESRFFIMLETPPGTSFDGTLEMVEYTEKWVREQPETAMVLAMVGGMGQEVRDVTKAMVIANLKPLEERERGVHEMVAAARLGIGKIPGVHTTVFNPNFSMGSGPGGDFEFNLLGNLELTEMDALADSFIRELEKRPGFNDLNKSLKLGLPELRVIPDRDKAAALGVSASSIAQVVHASIGGMDIAKFKEGGRRYDVRMRVEAEHRADPDSIGRLYVRSRNGDVVELRNVARIETGAAPSSITRLDRQRSVTIEANLDHDFPVGSAMAVLEDLAPDLLPDNVRIGYSGSAEAFLESITQFGMAIGLGILVIYMLLAAQFESLLHPLTVMLALPFAMFGALGALLAAGMTLNLFSLIGIILLFGLVTKNSILLIDFANQLRAQGMDRLEAIRTAAPIRMRPVLMTAISMIFGVLPAAVGVGPGSETRAPMAVATAAGMLSSTLLTLLVVPVFYVVLEDVTTWIGGHLGFRHKFTGAATGA